MASPPMSSYYPRPGAYMPPMGGATQVPPNGPYSLQMRHSAPIPPVVRSVNGPTELIFTSSEDAKQQKRTKATPIKRNLRCNMCNATETPEWRRGPDGEHTCVALPLSS